MDFSLATIIRCLRAPWHELSCTPGLWDELLRELRKRGQNRRESGAFLLGRRSGDRARIEAFIPYDDLDPRCLDTGIVRFDGRHFGALWAKCKELDLAVVADIHTHPGSAAQSDSDRAHPMIASAGHLSLIVPRFAAPPVRIEHLGIYRYQGSRRWAEIARLQRRAFFYVGAFG